VEKTREVGNFCIAHLAEMIHLFIEIMGSLFKRFSQSADEVLLSGQKDVDDFFEHEKNYLVKLFILYVDVLLNWKNLRSNTIPISAKRLPRLIGSAD
jgi:hypothetical protein